MSDLHDAVLLAFSALPQTAAADSFERGGHVITVDRDAGSGKFGDDGLADAVVDAVTVYGHQLVAGQSVASFDDPEGNFLDTPGRGVAFRDVEELGEIENDADVEESNYFSAAQAGQVADSLTAAATAARGEGTIGGLQRRATLKAGGLQIAAFNDGAGIWGDPETPYVAVSYQNGNPIDWDDPNLAMREGIDYTLFDPDEADDLADTLRTAAVAAPKAKAGVPRKVDRLALDGRIPLDPGERLTGSAGIDSNLLRYSEFDAVLAATQGLNGPQLRVGVDSWDDREWDAGDDGRTAVLDAAGFAELQQVMADLPAKADKMRADYARDHLDPQMAKIDALEARKQAIQDRAYEGEDVSATKMARIHDLQEKVDSLIRNSPGWEEYVALHRKRADLQRKYLRVEGDQMFSDPMSEEDRAEYDRLRIRTNEVSDSDRDIERIDRIHNEIHREASAGRDLTPEEKAEVKAINDELGNVFNDNTGPEIDEMMFAGRVAGTKWGDLRYEVHGSDSDWEDNPTGAGTWRLRLQPIPKGAPLDYHDGEGNYQQIDVYPADLAKVMRAFRKVYDTTTAQTAAAAPPRYKVGNRRLPAHVYKRLAEYGLPQRRAFAQRIADMLEIPVTLLGEMA